MNDVEIQPLASRHDRAAFSCGVPSLAAYIRTQAGQDVRRDLAICYILSEPGRSLIIGYYTLSATSIDAISLPAVLAKKYGRYHVLPATLIGRLAVDSRYRDQGLGETLLLDALRRTLRTGIASMAIIVDALNESAASFYERYGFRRFEDDRMRLYLTMSKVREIFPGEERTDISTPQ